MLGFWGIVKRVQIWPGFSTWFLSHSSPPPTPLPLPCAPSTIVNSDLGAILFHLGELAIVLGTGCTSWRHTGDVLHAPAPSDGTSFQDSCLAYLCCLFPEWIILMEHGFKCFYPLGYLSPYVFFPHSFHCFRSGCYNKNSIDWMA